MKIKRLEIAGFKSFADKVVLDFQQGVTGVVGPNGCGKSNIVDAIRWCMGEQSAKNLRGKAMDDVIFLGSENRKPLGMAEVSLVFSTEDGRAPAKYLEFSEIQLTRRLYRDGESEYLINKTPCRLLDISELFMDTGVGTKAYSIIEQGKIGQILHSRPEERRLLIEEAAGVTKYKTRKQLALKKIDATRQNLLRLSDVLGEIKRQLNALQRQAKKAEKFREHREELREIDLLFTLHQADSLQAEHQQTRQQLAEQQQRMQEVLSAADTSENQVELQRLAMLESEKGLSAEQEELFRMRSEAVACENGLTFRRKEQETITERLARLELEQQTVSERRETLAAELTRLQQHQQTTGSDLSAAEAQLASLQEEQQEQEQGFETLSRRIETQRRELFSATGEAAQCRTRQETARKRLDVLAERLERHSHEQIVVMEKQQENRRCHSSLTEQLERHQQEHRTATAQVALLAEQEQLLKTQLPELDKLVQSQRDELSRNSSRLTSLQELEAQFAGYGQGVRQLMTESPLRERLGGMLADTLLVPEEYELAVEAVLAERLQAVLCDNEQDLISALQYLREQATGRAQLAAPQQQPVAPQQINGTMPLLTLLEVSGQATVQLQRMLAPVHLVDTLESALALSRRHPDLTFVTRAGEVIASDGTVSAGPTESAQGGIIHKKREIRSLELQVQELSQLLASSEEEQKRIRAELQEAGQALQVARVDQHRLDLLLSGLTKDQQQLDGEAGRLAERLELLVHERATLEEEQTGLQEELKAADIGQQEAENRAKTLEQESQALSAELEGRRLILAAAREALTGQRVTVATLREQGEAHQRTVVSLTSQLAELELRIQNGSAEREQTENSRQRLRSELESEEQRLQVLLEQQVKQDEQLQVVRQQHEAAAMQLAAAEHDARLGREERETVRQLHADLSLKVSSLALQQEHLEQSLQDRHRLSLSDVRERLGQRELDPVTARIRQTDLERMIDELGEVNLMAIEEYAGMEQRYDFLAGQKADLEESLNDLQQAIHRINRTTRKRFLETFTQINEKFQEVFPRLFCGGKAELRLTDEQDLLETGIDIIVQPPGKKLANVMLLSGGEKALTAVALIFSIFLIKPTPFCLLDEVDAPLDDANIGRFNDMVREMSAISQFIIITHNKTTMAVADTLYGITMEEPGASRLVSVRLH
ncbi:MAG: chromosome segregation protein SMC [Geobacter sp.]|nr:chromosome segregation protein SMC [Geobacter sp.]